MITIIVFNKVLKQLLEDTNVATFAVGGHSYHHERVTNPKGVPAWRTRRNLNGLTVDSYHHSRSFTHNTSGHRESIRETHDIKTGVCFN